MTKEQIIENYKKARHITDGYVLDEDEMYFVEELVKVHAKLASNTEIIGSVSDCGVTKALKEDWDDIEGKGLDDKLEKW